MSISVIARCQTGAFGTSSTSNAFAVSSATSIGDLLVMCINLDSSGNTLNSVADSKGNAWNVDVASNSPGSNCLIASTVSTAALTTSDTITPQLASVSAQWATQTIQIRSTFGFNPQRYLDALNTANQTTTALSISVTTRYQNGIIVASFGYKHGVTPVLTFTQGSESTASFVTNKSSGQFDSIATEYFTNTTAGLKTATGTLSAASADTGAGSILGYFDQDPANAPNAIQTNQAYKRRARVAAW